MLYSAMRLTVWILIAVLVLPIPPVSALELGLPAPGTFVHLSPSLNPPVLKGIKVYPENPLRFDFILDKGDRLISQAQLKTESTTLIKYFLAALTTPEKDLWVNLSPYENTRIVPEGFGQTQMGRDLLAQDYLLKQITSSLIYPEEEIGRQFWKRVYSEAVAKYGTINISVNTFNKVWIVPDKAKIFENASAKTAYVIQSRLKVMLESDYLAQNKNILKSPQEKIDDAMIRQVVLPELNREINEGENFLQLRQVYSSLVLAAWYKKKIKDSIITQVYNNKNKVAGVSIDDPKEIQRIYELYVQAFKKGAFNYIKSEIDPVSRQSIPRKYFSGGAAFSSIQTDLELSENRRDVNGLSETNLAMIASHMKSQSNPGPDDAAMTRGVPEGKDYLVVGTEHLEPQLAARLDNIVANVIGNGNIQQFQNSFYEFLKLELVKRAVAAEISFGKWLDNKIRRQKKTYTGFGIEMSARALEDKIKIMKPEYKLVFAAIKRGFPHNFREMAVAYDMLRNGAILSLFRSDSELVKGLVLAGVDDDETKHRAFRLYENDFVPVLNSLYHLDQVGQMAFVQLTDRMDMEDYQPNSNDIEQVIEAFAEPVREQAKPQVTRGIEINKEINLWAKDRRNPSIAKNVSVLLPKGALVELGRAHTDAVTKLLDGQGFPAASHIHGVTPDDAAMTRSAKARDLAIDKEFQLDPSNLEDWTFAIDFHRDLLKLTDQLTRLTNEYESVGKFPPQQRQEVWNTLERLAKVSSLKPHEPLNKLQKYVAGFVTSNAVDINIDYRYHRALAVNLMVLFLVMKSGLSQEQLKNLSWPHFDDGRGYRYYQADQRPAAIKDMMRMATIRVNAETLGIIVDEAAQARLRSEVDGVFSSFHQERVSYYEIVSQLVDKGSSIVKLAPGYQERFPDEFFRSPSQFFSEQNVLNFEENSADDGDIARVLGRGLIRPYMQKESHGKIRHFILSDGTKVYAKRVNPMRSQFPWEEAVLAARIEKDFIARKVHVRVPKYIGLVRDQGNYYLLSEGINIHTPQAVPPNIFQSISAVLHQNGVAHAGDQKDEEQLRLKEIFQDDHGGWVVFDFETMPYDDGIPDNAMLKGGIDLNTDSLNLDTQGLGGGIEFQSDPALLEGLRNSTGFAPEIIDVQPVLDLRLFLGLPA